jgi:hypothetical protein
MSDSVRRMTDREMLLLAYGALKSTSQAQSFNSLGLRDVVNLIEDHFYPPQIVNEAHGSGHFTNKSGETIDQS